MLILANGEAKYFFGMGWTGIARRANQLAENGRERPQVPLLESERALARIPDKATLGAVERSAGRGTADRFSDLFFYFNNLWLANLLGSTVSP